MDEVFKYQDAITNSIESANDKFTDIERVHQLSERISRTKDYQDKIVNLRRSLLALKDKSSRLRRRANKILEYKNKEDIEQQRLKERREALEKHLEPVVSTRRD